MWRFARAGAIVLFLALPALPAWAASPVASVLPNGLRVILIPEPKAPVVSVQVWYRVGSRDEVSGKTGLSHLMEHMMFKGTARYGKGAFSRRIAEHGGNDNAFTSHDYTAYFENLSKDHIGLALELEADRMTGLVIADDEFGLERDVVKEERRMRTDDDPQGTLIEHVYAAAYMVHPYHWPVIGWMDDLERLTADDIRAYYRTHYSPANAVLVIAGDFDPRAVLVLIEQTVGRVAGPGAPARRAVVEPLQLGERRVTVKKDAQLPAVIAGYQVPNFRDPDAYALTVLAAVLTQGESSRLHRALVYDRQVALEVGGDYTALSADAPIFYLYAVTQAGKSAEDLERALFEEVERLKATEPSERELTKVKNGIEADFILGQDSNFYRAMQVGTAETVGAGREYLDHFVANIRKVTAADVTRVAKAYFTADRRTVGTLIPTRPADSADSAGAAAP
ncbi:MAG: M16 family metallopeptidase [Nitrospirota bacterium]